MITIKKKTLFVFFFIFFLINVFLISKRRDFNFYNLKFIFDNEKYSNINKNLNYEFINAGLNNILIFLKKNKIREINFDKTFLKENDNILTNEDLIFFLYPTKLNNKSNYIIGYFNDKKYNKCKSSFPKPLVEEIRLNKLPTVYFCE